jgi:hypothetical protein
MQRPRRGDERRRRETGAENEGQAKSRGDAEDQRADDADRDAGDRRPRADE